MRRWLKRKRTRVAMEPTRLPRDPVARANMLREFSGCWIAILEDKVVAAGPTADDVFRQIDDKGLPGASITRIPDPALGVAIGLG